MSLDDMMLGSSAYLKEDYVKRKFMDTWDELCSLLNIPSTIELAHEDREQDTYSTSYPEINRRVQRLLKTDEFPDYTDICNLIDRCNTKHSLGISMSEKVDISKKLFRTVGSIIKSRRAMDYKAHFGSHLTDLVKMDEDPATSNAGLLQQLHRSMEQGRKQMQDMVDGFVVKQEVEMEKKEEASTHEEESCTSNEEEEEEGEENVCKVDSEPSEDESPVAKRLKLEPEASNGVDSHSSTSVATLGGLTEVGEEGTPAISPQDSASSLQGSGSSAIDVGTAEDEQASCCTTTNIIIPDSDSDIICISSGDSD